MPSENNFQLLCALKRWESGVVYPRVNVGEHKENLREIIEISRSYGAKTILIQPVIPKYWHPGMRAKGEEAAVWQVMYEHKGEKAIEMLEKAIHLYDEAVQMYGRAGSQEQRKQAENIFIAAQNDDYLVPRIKPEYVAALQQIAQETGTRLVIVQDQIPLDDRSYFIDYCHPIELANKLIARGVSDEITAR